MGRSARPRSPLAMRRVISAPAGGCQRVRVRAPQNSTQNTVGHATAACSVVDQLSLGRPPSLHATMRHLLTASPGGEILSGWHWLEMR